MPMKIRIIEAEAIKNYQVFKHFTFQSGNCVLVIVVRKVASVCKCVCAVVHACGAIDVDGRG
jgi:hypothetical protein